MKKKQNILCFFAVATAILLLFMTLGGCKKEEHNAGEKIEEQNCDIRVMSYNILHPDWSNAANSAVEDRIKLVQDIILDYAPDVIGLQETASVWHTALEIVLCDNNTYKFACKFNNVDKIRHLC